nr:reverse transcriptase domain-containing protein [Tanacetum cinerariifolium]
MKRRGPPSPDNRHPPALVEKSPGIKKNKAKDELPKAPNERKPSEKVVTHDGHPDQTVTIGGNLTTECMTDIIEILRKHADAFAWTLTDMTGIPRFIAEHELKIYPHIEPRVQRKR